MSTRRRLLIAVAAIAAVKVVAYRTWVKPWMFHWGAIPDEVDAELPGDELVDGTGPRTTRAVTVDAPPERVWPWVAQIGEDRAGFYSYAWLERLAGCDMHNADWIHPEWQHHEAGETVWLARRYRELGRQVVARIEPGRVFAMVSPPDHDALVAGRRATGAWTFVLEPTADGRQTRLIARGSGGAVGHAAFDVPHFVMEQKMLRGIKARAEGTR
ncbi:MAG: hypothetical protein U0W40_18265 [Acidimicrobiia bacterium]